MVKIVKASTVIVSIFIAGDLEQAKQVCREWCMEVGDCVTVEPISYIYTGGEEVGVRIGFINYPRLPSDETNIVERATRLAMRLMEKLCQLSFSVVAPSETIWYSRRAEIDTPAGRATLAQGGEKNDK